MTLSGVPEGLKSLTMNPTLLRWASVGLLGFTMFLVTWQLVADESGLPYRYWARYTSSLERKLRPMFIFTPGRHIAQGQLGALFLVVAMSQIIDTTPVVWWFLGLAIVAGPTLYIDSERRKRVLLIEEQLDNFVQALASALKSTPSIGAAFSSVGAVLEDPIRREIDLAIKEMKVGSTLEQALLHMAARVGSRELDSALSSILIGRQVGGNLPRVLETTAQTLREMKRLEGVIRTKTADGRMQMWVIGLMPFAVVAGFSTFWPGYFAPLTTSTTGYIIVAVVTTLWISAVLLARKVLAVNI